MKRSIKFVSLICGVVMALGLMVGCGGGSSKATTAASGSSEVGTSKTVDVADFTAVVPAGWESYTVKDSEGNVSPEHLNLSKGSKNENDMNEHPVVNIMFTPKENKIAIPQKSMYEAVEDLKEHKSGDLAWKGFSGKSYGETLVVYWCEDPNNQFMVVLWPDRGPEKEHLKKDDPVIFEILDGLKAK